MSDAVTRAQALLAMPVDGVSRNSLRHALGEVLAELSEAREIGRSEGRADVAEYSRAIGEIEAALGIVGAVPMRETVNAVRGMALRIAALEAELAQLKQPGALVLDAGEVAVVVEALRLAAPSIAEAQEDFWAPSDKRVNAMLALARKLEAAAKPGSGE